MPPRTKTAPKPTAARVNPRTLDVEPVKAPRCKVCGDRPAVNPDGTCNDPGCPAHSVRMKTAAESRQAELKAQARTQPQAQPKAQAGDAQAKDAVGWRWRHHTGQFGVLAISRAGVTAEYMVWWVARVVFNLQKLEPGRVTSYTVIVPEDDRVAHHCGCDGHKRTGSCKHVEAIAALRKSDRL